MRVTPCHWEAFIEIAEKNPVLITNKFNGVEGKSLGNTLWQTVVTKLNSLGYGEKTVHEWRRAVTDWKSKVKSKASKIRNSALQTGGGSSNVPPLTPIEEKQINLMGRKSFEGDVGIQELGQSIKFPPKLFVPEVLTEIEVVGESTEIYTDHEYVAAEKRCNDDEENGCPITSQKRKRQRIASIPRISKNLVEMTSESLNILRNIDTNISRIADSFQDIVDILRKQLISFNTDNV